MTALKSTACAARSCSGLCAAGTATTFGYDNNGNQTSVAAPLSRNTAKQYDALNRVTQQAYTDQVINFTYDAGTNGKGRLTGASDANHALSWTYDAQGRVTGKAQTVGSVTKGVGYAYSNGDLTSLITPSGQTITYGYTNHRITSVKVNTTTLISGVTYDPFGPATGWTWSDAAVTSRTFDLDGAPSQFVTPGLTANVTNVFTVDAASRITGITGITDTGNTSVGETYAYDALDRITSGVSGFRSRGYNYDGSGNLLSITGATASTETISPTSNRLNSTSGAIARTYSYDNAGNTTGYTGAAFTFNQRGRMSTATVSAGVTSYIYNALGQLIEKSGNGGTTIIVYDEAGHLLGEYSSSGALIQETIWMGDTPVATLRPNGSTIAIYYVHTDHLGSARKVEGPLFNGLAWRWDPDVYGTNLGPVSLTYNLRFPGMYYLPETGRYLESDPIGLAGGRNTYLYAHANPLSRTDRRGTGGPSVTGTGIDDILQNAPDSKCDILPALCIAKAVVCTEATCTYSDCHGKPFVIGGVSFLPTPPNREELQKESPNCKCTKWSFAGDE